VCTAGMRQGGGRVACAGLLVAALVAACAPAAAVPRVRMLTPLVVVLHGLGGTGAEAAAGFGFSEVDGVLVAHPDGVGGSWNAGACCGPAHERGVDDVARLDALVARMVAQEGADPRRVYAVGFSNGAMMAYAWACGSRTLAGIGVVGGARVAPCPDPGPVAVVAVHGDADHNVPIGGGVGALSVTGFDYPSLAESLAPFPDAEVVVLPGVGHEWVPGTTQRLWQRLRTAVRPS
jgi:poly(3-hydroxybutyrate) depolymerase